MLYLWYYVNPARKHPSGKWYYPPVGALRLHTPLLSTLSCRSGSDPVLWNTRIWICSGHLQAEVSDPDLV